MDIKYTRNFDSLLSDKKESIKSITEGPKFDISWNRLHKEQNRSIIFYSEEFNLVYKFFRDKGKRDKDIEALLALDKSKYFPKVYAFKEKEFVIMEKVSGDTLDSILRVLSEEEKEDLKIQLYSALNDMLDSGWYDYDYKEEHIFWDRENKKLMWIDLGLCSPIDLEDKNKIHRIRQFYNGKENLIPDSLILT